MLMNLLELRNERIAVDLCNTTADILEQLNIRLGVTKDLKEYFHSGLVGKNNYFIENVDLFLAAKPLEQSIEGLRLLARYNEIIYLTARPVEAKEITENWLHKYSYPKGKLFFSEDKPSIAKGHGIKYAIEDAPHEIDSYLQAGVSVFVYKQSYNENYPNRFSWTELL